MSDHPLHDDPLRDEPLHDEPMRDEPVREAPADAVPLQPADPPAPDRPAGGEPALPSAGESTQPIVTSTPAAGPAAAKQGEETSTPSLGGWLPISRQVLAAVRLDLPAAVGPEPDWPYFLRGLHTSMRQAAGLIVVTALLVGLPMLIATWVALAEIHSTLQLLHLQENVRRFDVLTPDRLAPGLATALRETGELAAGLTPLAPPQSAAGLSALSLWLALPLRLLTFWLAYGLLVLTMAKALGAGTTLPRFYAATGYAVLPLLLYLGAPLPVIGPWLVGLGVVFALVAYVLATAFVTAMDRWRAAIAVLLPAAVLSLAALMAAVVYSVGMV